MEMFLDSPDAAREGRWLGSSCFFSPFKLTDKLEMAWAKQMRGHCCWRQLRGLSNSPCNHNNQPNSIKNCNKMTLQGRLGGVMCVIDSSWATRVGCSGSYASTETPSRISSTQSPTFLCSAAGDAPSFSHAENLLFLRTSLTYRLNLAQCSSTESGLRRRST